jgi:hypothetical protein
MADTLFTRVHLAAMSRSNAVNDTIASVLSSTVASAGVLAELNLIRRFVTDCRESRREQARRRRRPAATRQSSASTLGIGPSRRVPAAAALLCGVMPSAALAQQSSTPAEAAASAGVTPAQDQLKLNTDATLTLQPSAAASEPAPLVISTDRPSFSDTAGIAPVGHLQLETGYTFTFRNRDGVETQRHNGPELLARVGLLDDRLEFRATTSGYTWSRTDDGTGSGYASNEGFSDVALGFKLKLTDQDGALPRLALEGVTTVGAGSQDISSRRAEPTIKLIWSYDLEKLWGDNWRGFGVYGNVNLAYATTNGDRFLQGAGSICGTYAVNDMLGVFAEYYVVGPAAKGTDAAHYFDFGGAYLLSNRVQLDARVGFGLNRTADNVYVGVGISFLF